MTSQLLDRADLEALAAVAYAHACAHEDGGAGLCLPVAAALGWVLRDVVGVTSSAVSGSFDGQAHWWLEVDGLRVDPTRHQFDGDDQLLHPVSASDGYAGEVTYVAGWARALAAAEAQRAFAWPAAGALWVEPLLDELEATAEALGLRRA